MDEIKQAARKARNDYIREWRRSHPEAVKAQRERYWMKRAKKLLEAQEQEGNNGTI